jgi:hypothetical protein
MRQGAGSAALDGVRVNIGKDAITCYSNPESELGQPCDIDESDLCPQSDSNRHLTDFKSAASANWAMGASDEFSVLTPDSVGLPLPQDDAEKVLKVAP